MSTADKSSKTLTVGQLIDQLSRLDPDMPVVMYAEDEPCGNYGVRSVEVQTMYREDAFAAEPFGKDVFHSTEWGLSRSEWDQARPAAFLNPERQWQPVIDAEIIRPELTAGS